MVKMEAAVEEVERSREEWKAEVVSVEEFERLMEEGHNFLYGPPK